ncbi:MAG TPA: matrixin family metalloprotease [Thermoanaerobaculia bacterium]|nr:matrixin family metalloprotease [Thermoanaerobaculia bacterium]
MLRRLAVVPFAILLSVPALAATRMTFDIQGAPTAIEWAPTAFPLRYDIDRRVTDLNPNAAAMIEHAFDAWASLPDVSLRFESRGVVPASVPNGEGISVSLADDLLSGQGAIALTTYTYDASTGRMLDADIRLDPSIFQGGVNAQAALEHEVGHTLGLDHSAVLSSVMYPYVGPSDTQADLDADDRIAIAMIYPKTDPTLRGATLQGRVLGDDGGIFAAQVVAVNERGQPTASGLTNAEGEFTLPGVPAGRYRLYVEPLDGPVVVSALQGTWRQAALKPFPTEFFDSPITVENGKVYGNLVVNTAGAVRLNPSLIGAADPSSNSVSLNSSPVAVHPGQTVKLTVGGDGFTSGMTQFEVLNPAFQRISDFEYWGGSVSATFAIAADAPSASSVIVVRNGNEMATLTGALRVFGSKKARAMRSR